MAIESRSSERQGWTAVIVFLIFYALGYLDKKLITLLIDPIRHSIGASDVEMSVIAGLAFVSFYVLFSFPIGWAVDRLSRRAIIFWGVVVWSGAAACGGLARTTGGLLFSRFGVGAGEATLLPAAHSVIADLFPKEKLTRALGVFTLGAFLGSALSFGVGGMAMGFLAHQGSIELPLLGQLEPWQVVLIMTGAPGILLAFLVFLIKEPTRRHLAQTAQGSEGRSANVLAFLAGHWRFYAPHFLGFSILSVMTSGFSTWLPTHLLRSYDEPVQSVGLTLALFQLTIGPLGMLLMTQAVDRMFKRGRRDIHMIFYVWGALAIGIGGVIVGLAPSIGIAYGGVLLVDSLHGFLPAAGAALQITTPNQFRGQVTALFFVFYNVIGQALGPIVVAGFTDFVFLDPKMVGASLALTCAIVAPTAALLLWLGARPMREAVRAEETLQRRSA